MIRSVSFTKDTLENLRSQTGEEANLEVLLFSLYHYSLLKIHICIGCFISLQDFNDSDEIRAQNHSARECNDSKTFET